MKKRGLLILAAATLLFACGQPAESSSLPSSEESSVAPSASSSDEKSGFVDATKDLVLVYQEDLEEYPFPGYFVADYKGKEAKILIPDEATVDGRTAPILGVEKYAFSKRTGIEAIAFGKNVTYLGEGAFLDSGIKKIYGTSSLVRIHKDAFAQSQIEFHRNDSGMLCIPSFENEECVVISASSATQSEKPLANVEAIADHAFDNASNLPTLPRQIVAVGDLERKDGERFKLASSNVRLRHIGANALEGTIALPLQGPRTYVGEGFYKCSVQEPKLAFLGEETSLAIGAFSAMESTEGKAVQLSFDPAHWFDVSGKKALSDPNVEVAFPADVASPFGTMKTRFDAPNTIRSIGAYEFARCTGLESVSIPNAVLIGEYAFYGCLKLKAFDTSASGEKPISVGARAFAGCKSLEYFGGNISSFGAAPFEGCSSLKKISVDGIRLNGATFKKDLFGSDSLDSIALETIQCDFDGAVDYSGLTKLTLFPPLTASLGSFDGCASITTLTIPEGVTELPTYFCRNCVSLQNVKLPSTLKKIGNSAFQGCTSLQSVEIPDGVESIGVASFASSGLTEVTIPSSVKTIGERALSTSSLKSVSLPIGLESVDSTAFSDCSSSMKVSIRYSTTEELFAKRSYHESLRLFDKRYETREGNVLKELQVPSSVKSIYPYQFHRCKDLVSLSFADGIEEIGGFAFDYCSGLAGKIVLPDSLKSASSLFGNCPSVTEVSVPSTIETLSNCESLSIRMVSPESLLSHPASSWRNVSSWKLTDQSGEEVTSLSIPSTALETWASMEGVPFGLRNCSNLEEVALPEGTTSLPDYLFSYCSSLQTVHLPSTLASIGEYSFQFCSKLVEIALPDSLVEIKQRGFYSCQKLETVQFGNALKTIGAYAFAYAYMLKSVALPSPLETIGASAFYRAALETVSFPSALASIGQNAFNQTYLSNVYIPVSVTSIGKGAFTEIHQNSFSVSCGAASKPDGWDSGWIWSGAQITWGVPEP